jgi:NADPH:quinone reductase-like Zn-dependent oxidoreductase
LSTSSPKNFAYVKSLGATEVFDYNEPNVGLKIREHTQNELKLAWDTIGEGESGKIIGEAMSTESGGRYGTIGLNTNFPRKDVNYVSTIMYTIFGEHFVLGPMDFPADAEDFEYTKKFLGITETLLAEGKLKVHTPEIGKDGLKGVLKGLEDLKNGKVSGQKLVYRVSETP